MKVVILALAIIALTVFAKHYTGLPAAFVVSCAALTLGVGLRIRR